MASDGVDRATTTNVDAFYRRFSNEEIISYQGVPLQDIRYLWTTYCGPHTPLPKGTVGRSPPLPVATHSPSLPCPHGATPMVTNLDCHDPINYLIRAHVLT